MLEGWSLEERGTVIVVAGGRSLMIVGEDGRNGDRDGGRLRESGGLIELGGRGRPMEAGRDVGVMKWEGSGDALMHESINR